MFPTPVPDCGPQLERRRRGCARVGGDRRSDGGRGGCCGLSMRSDNRPVIPFVTNNERMQYAVIKKNYPPNYTLPASTLLICNT